MGPKRFSKAQRVSATTDWQDPQECKAAGFADAHHHQLSHARSRDRQTTTSQMTANTSDGLMPRSCLAVMRPGVSCLEAIARTLRKPSDARALLMRSGFLAILAATSYGEPRSRKASVGGRWCVVGLPRRAVISPYLSPASSRTWHRTRVVQPFECGHLGANSSKVGLLASVVRRFFSNFPDKGVPTMPDTAANTAAATLNETVSVLDMAENAEEYAL